MLVHGLLLCVFRAFVARVVGESFSPPARRDRRGECEADGVVKKVGKIKKAAYAAFSLAPQPGLEPGTP